MYRIPVVVLGVFIGAASVTYATQQVVGQKGRLFSPGAMTVNVGDVVVFQNDDAVTHHVYSSTKGQEFKLDTIAPGKEATHAFTAKGRVDVRCGLHPGMRLVVTVE
jgi:plastocyanin